jgi:hypothetical protein
MCAVVGKIAGRARDGLEQWGTFHQLPPIDVTEQRATEIRQALFAARYCRRLAAEHGALSVSVMWERPDGQRVNGDPVRAEGGYRLVVRVWTRPKAKKEIVRRVNNNEPLDYNRMKA